MARITAKDLKKIREAVKFKGTIHRGVKWTIPSRKAKATAKSWNKTLETKEKES